MVSVKFLGNAAITEFFFFLAYLSFEKLSADISSLIIVTLFNLGILSLGILILLSIEIGESIVGDPSFLLLIIDEFKDSSD